MITTLEALGVALVALLPGASYTFAYERKVGNFGVSLSDRLIRFLAASAGFAALFSGPLLLLYRTQIVSGNLSRGDINWVVFELAALTYVVVPSFVGSLVGRSQKHGGKIGQVLVGGELEPRAWDYRWRRKEIRMCD